MNIPTADDGPRLEGPGSAARARALRARFSRATRASGRLRTPRRRAVEWSRGMTVWLMVWAACVGASAAVIVMTLPDGSWSERLRHVAAVPNCAAARAVGLAPAVRGAAGYWPAHDRDRDGVACEAFELR